jgi:hypothetical protein
MTPLGVLGPLLDRHRPDDDHRLPGQRIANRLDQAGMLTNAPGSLAQRAMIVTG